MRLSARKPASSGQRCISRRPLLQVLLPAVLAAVVAVGGAFLSTARATHEKVLILEPTVSGGASSIEAMAATALGYTVEVVDEATWAAKTTADFGSYKALVLGDPTCGSGTEDDAAEANKAVWGAAVDGNVVINGTDPVFHSSSGGEALTNAGIKFATDAAGKTGMYISLSCYYHDAAPSTAVPLLDAFGTFTVTGVGCFDDAHIVATHPALQGLTDADLSNWSCSVHEAFDAWPQSGPGAFTVLAIAKDAGTTYMAPDGTVGIPYILARGEGLAAGDISLSPATGSAPADGVAQQCVTALVSSGGTPQSGVTVHFTIVSGPNAGAALADGSTAADGTVQRCYTSTATGTDTLQASFTEGAVTQTSNQVTREWTSAGTNVPPTASAGGPYAGVEGSAVAISGSASDGDGDALTYTWSATPGAGTDPGAACVFGDATALSTTVMCNDDGSFTLTLTVNDGNNPDVTSTAALTVTNADPSVSIASPADSSVSAVGAPVMVSAPFTDAGANDTHTCVVDFGDGSGPAPGVVSAGVCTATHSYATAGGVTVIVTVTDDDGGSGSAQITLVIEATPAKVTGGGFILDNGRTSFGFNARRDASGALSGQIQVQTAAGSNFHGDVVTSLAASGNTASWSGSGSLDGASGYTFTVSVVDNRDGGGNKGTADTISIVINDPGGATAFSSSGALAGGNIQVH